jgi:putative membrane protein
MNGWSDGWIGLVWMVLVWGAILAVVFVLVRAMTNAPARGEHPTPGPLEILDARFARGEISAEEYAERRRILQGTGI